MNINFDKIQSNVEKHLKSDDMRSEKVLPAISAAIILAIKEYHAELLVALDKNKE